MTTETNPVITLDLTAEEVAFCRLALKEIRHRMEMDLEQNPDCFLNASFKTFVVEHKELENKLKKILVEKCPWFTESLK